MIGLVYFLLIVVFCAAAVGVAAIIAMLLVLFLRSLWRTFTAAWMEIGRQ